MGAGLVLLLLARALTRLGSGGLPEIPVASVLPVAGAVAAGAGGLLVLRSVLTRRALAGRVVVDLLPAEDFDPTEEDVEALVAGLGRVRPRGGWLTRGASASRLELVVDAEGLLRMRASCAGGSAAALEAALASFPKVELHEPVDLPAAVGGRLGRVVRARLVLARPAHHALAQTGLQPDLLQAVAAAVDGLDPGRGEQARLVLDVAPLSAGQAGRVRRRLLGRRDGTGPLRSLAAGGGGRPRGRLSAGESVERRHDTQGLDRKLAPEHPLLRFAMYLRVEAADRRRALQTTRSLLGALDAMGAANHLRAQGLRLGRQGFLGHDLPWRRRRFDRRLASGRFTGRRNDIVSPGEVQGLLKPPTMHCHAANVARSRGEIPAPPRDLPIYDGRPGIIPLGRVRTRVGERVVGVRTDETFFSYMSGRSRYGKTETAIGQFIALVLQGHGGLFLDPHGDALAEILTYLTAAGVRERVVLIDLSDRDPDTPQPGWNLFGLASRTHADAAGKVDAFVDALAAALRWDERNTRALNLATQSAQALTELALALPAELAPTIFEVPTLLSDDEWRAAVLPRLSPATRGFFEDRFPSLPGEAITAVTNLLDRLRASRSLTALLGSPVSTYDAQRALANDWIVLACPGPGSTRDTLIANLLVYDVLHAAKRRASMPPRERRPFWVFLDELQTYDGPNLPALLEQSAKYGGRGFLLNQNPERLTAATWNAVSTNRSHLLSAAVNSKAARMIGAEWGSPPAPDVLTRLDAYTYLASVRVGRTVSPAFLVQGIPAAELHAQHRHPDHVDQLLEAVDRTARRRPVEERLAEAETHGRRIRDHLAEPRRQSGGGGGRPHVVRTEDGDQ